MDGFITNGYAAPSLAVRLTAPTHCGIEPDQQQAACPSMPRWTLSSSSFGTFVYTLIACARSTRSSALLSSLIHTTKLLLCDNFIYQGHIHPLPYLCNRVARLLPFCRFMLSQAPATTGTPSATAASMSQPPSPTRPAIRPASVETAIAIGQPHICRNDRLMGFPRQAAAIALARRAACCPTVLACCLLPYGCRGAAIDKARCRAR